MKPGSFAAYCFAGLVFACSGLHADDLENNFTHPPDSARPWVNWFWLDGNITREGITADLEAMQRVGIGGVLLMDITQDIPPGPVPFGGLEWRALFKHTVKEADRLGLQVCIHNGPGWCGSGGPWIPPDMAMRKVVSSRTNLLGPTHFIGVLPPLPGDKGEGHEIATLAFPTLVGEGAPVPGFAPKITSSGPAIIDGGKLLDGDASTCIEVPAPHGKNQYLQLEFDKPFTGSYLKLTEKGPPQHFQGRLQVSDNGKTFKDIREFMSTDKGLALPFEMVSARYFRLLFTKSDSRLDHLVFAELELTPVFRIDLAGAKAGLSRLPPSQSKSLSLSNLPPYAAISPQTIINLTSRSTQNSYLDWDVPKGRWTIVRLGHIPTGQLNHPARAEGVGLECDKLNGQAVDTHFAAFLGQLISDVGDLAGRSFMGTHIDSWESGFQNWTPRFQQEFQQQHGYDPLPWLPALTGRIVGSLDQSERFLWDVRRTIANLLAENYAGRLARLAHEHHLQLSIEAYGNGPFDDLLYGGRADVPMAEFWLEPRDYSTFQNKAMPSVAHTYGKPIVAAEAFTSYPLSAKWQNHPFALKPLGDAAFCEGINRLVFHRYAHQPWLDRQPGMTMGQWGVHYERTETWWNQSKPWHEYLARCQYLLQSGLFVADLCYVTDEGAYTEAPSRSQLEPPVPDGYDYDLAAPEVVLTRMSVKDGRLVLPDGMSYRLLVLPTGQTMTPKLLRKIKELVRAGATIVGTPPKQSPSREGFPACDAEVRQIAAELWGNCDGKQIKEHDLGKGKVIWSSPLAGTLAQSAIPIDFEQRTKFPGAHLRWIHRIINGADFYFVADSNPQPLSADCFFRVKGKQPEFWHPETGDIQKAVVWHEDGSGTAVTLKLEPAGSVFVVFRNRAAGVDPVLTLQRNGQDAQDTKILLGPNNEPEIVTGENGIFEAKTVSRKVKRAQIKATPSPLVLDGKWDVQFPSGWGAPAHVRFDHLISWTEHTNTGVKYFSGTATYTKNFALRPDLLANHRQLMLNLGKVEVIATVKVNGQDLGILWKPPFTLDITRAVRSGENQLQVQVVNLWPNRLIGDEQLHEDCEWRTHGASYGDPLLKWPSWLLQGKPSPTGRLTFATWRHWQKDSPLLESGLLGPVTIDIVQKVALKE